MAYKVVLSNEIAKLRGLMRSFRLLFIFLK